MIGRAARAFTVAMLAAVQIAGSGASARAEEPKVVAYLRATRCMMPTGGPLRGEGGPPAVLAAPRPGAPTLGTASDPVIADDPLRVVNGHMRVLHADGRTGWVRRDRLRAWRVAASPGLRCLPARMSDGRLGFGYAHPG